MKTALLICTGVLIGISVHADTHYVDINNLTPSDPYTSWGTAATNIQDAVDEAVVGDTVLVNDGHYHITGSISVYLDITVQSVNGPDLTIIDGGGSTRCFELNVPCMISGFTVTNGYTDAFGGGIFCANESPVVTNCTISGNSASGHGGGMYLGTASHCAIISNSATYGGGKSHGTANNCSIISNSATYGGGIYNGTANNCSIINNTAASNGGGVWDGTANTCTVISNSASSYGGGIYYSTANDCTISRNFARFGGGLYSGTANNCTVSENTADVVGGGLYHSRASSCIINGNTARFVGGGVYCPVTATLIENCAIIGNSATYSGGGMRGGTANNCTITGNFGSEPGGGIVGSIVNNSIVRYNITGSPANNINDCTVKYSCSTDVTHGVDGNITNAPLLASSFRIAANSPCRGAGSSLYSSGADIDSELWLNPPSMGCDEINATGSVTGLVDVAIEGSFKTVAGHPIALFGNIRGSVTMHIWDFGDGTGITNNPYPVHVWVSPGNYDIVLTAYSDTYPAGISVTQDMQVVSQIGSETYVSGATGSDTYDGLSWATAKATIQAGVDAQVYQGGMVCVSNGMYVITTEIAVARDVLIQSVHGSSSTIVDAVGTNRCFNLGNSASIIRGFTIQNANTEENGGGVYCRGTVGIVEDCIISNNAAAAGGGIFGGQAYGCLITGNTAKGIGGGMDDGSAYNCTITGNSAQFGGGLDIGFGSDSLGGISGSANQCIIAGNSAEEGGGIRGGIARNCLIVGNVATNRGGGTLETMSINCTIADNVASNIGGGSYKTIDLADCNTIIYYNTAPSNSNLYSIGPVTNCCSPDAVDGVNGGVTAAPMFVDHLAGNYMLQPNSPCINWGSNVSVTDSLDLANGPRVAETYVDIGCYEYQDILGLSDSDGDGLSDEWERNYFGGNILPDDNADGDEPSNGDEYVAGTDPTNAASFFTVNYSVATNGGFIVEWVSVTGRVYNVLWAPSLDIPFQPIAIGIPYPQNSYTDTVYGAESSGFYRVEVIRADWDSVSDFTYEINSPDTNTVTITGYTGAGGDVVIPSIIDGRLVTHIGDDTFWNRDNLTSVVVGNGVTSIGDSAFAYCDGLMSISIGSGVTSIGEDVFYSCDILSAIMVDVGNAVFSSADGVLFDKNKTTLILCPLGKAGEYAIPDGVATIGYEAFRGNNGLTSITMPDSVGTIEHYAFAYCFGGLTNVTIGSGVTSMEDYAFAYCYDLESVMINSGVTDIGDYAFYSCHSLMSITIPDSVTSIGYRAFQYTTLTNVTIGSGVTHIGDLAFYTCSQLTSLTIPDGVITIGYGAFSECTGLKSVTIPDSVTVIGASAFNSCAGVTNVTIGSGVTNIQDYAFSGCDGLTSIVIPDNVTSIGERTFSYCYGLKSAEMGSGLYVIGRSAFEKCGSLTNVTIGTNVDTILDYAFQYCTNLLSVTIPDSVTTIEDSAFAFCSGLTNVTIGANVTTIRYNVFFFCTSLVSLEIPDSVISIHGSAFGYCTSLTNLTMGSGVAYIGSEVFRSCTNLPAITVDTNNTTFSSADGVLFNKSQTSLIQYPEGKAGDYIVPGSVLVINQEAFAYCILTGVTIPDSVTTIEARVFEKCASLTNITIGSGVTILGSSMFQSCTSLESITIPGTVEIIGYDAFAYCSGLMNVTIGDGVTTIKSGAFGGCNSLTDINIPESVSTIGYGAFAGCSSLASITIPNYVGIIESSTFANCTNLTTVTIGSGVTSIEGDAFAYCSSLLSVFIPDSVTSIGWRAFLGCTALKTVTIGSEVTTIYPYVFAYCTALTGIYFKGDAPLPDNSAFQDAAQSIVYYLPGTTGWGAAYSARPTQLWNPSILTDDGSFGVQAGEFGFNISGTSNELVKIETCTNLVEGVWEPIVTGSLSNGAAYFSDADYTNHFARFYQLDMP